MRNGSIPLAALALAALAAPAAAEFRIEKRFELAPTANFVLRSAVGDLSVRGVEGSAATVTIASDREDFERSFSVRFESEGPDRLAVVIERRKADLFQWFSGFGSRTNIEVTLPAGATAEIDGSGGAIALAGLGGTVRAESSGGPVRARDLGGDALLSSSGGRVEVEGVGGDLEAESSGGGIEVVRVAGRARLHSSGGSVRAEEIGGDLEASSSGGSVRIFEAHGRVEANSSGGSAEVAFAAGNGAGGRVQSSGGGVRVTLDPAAALEIDAVATGGRVSSDLAVTVHGSIRRGTLRGQLNGGGPRLELRSTGGGVTIRAR